MEDLKEEFYDEKDNEKIEEEETAIDHFSMFMFGTNRQSVRKSSRLNISSITTNNHPTAEERKGMIGFLEEVAEKHSK
ncbi:hypothetical protein AAHH67_24625 [Niallia circulans]